MNNAARKQAGAEDLNVLEAEREIRELVLGTPGDSAGFAQLADISRHPKQAAMLEALRRLAGESGVVEESGNETTKAKETAMTASKKVRIGFAEKQRSFETQQKIHLARFAVAKAGLQDGQGAVIDAGTTCLEVWNEFCKDITTNGRLLSIRSNSNLILRSWENSEAIGVRETQVRILGSVLDREHQAFFEGSTPQLLDEEHFMPAAVFIGTSGVKFDANGRMWFSYHAGEREGVFKQLLFKCTTEMRIILATATKTGFRGANAFDVLNVPDLDRQAPLVLVTTRPGKTDDEKTHRQFDQTLEMLNSDAVQSRIRETGLDLTWVVLDAETGKEVSLLPTMATEKSAVQPVVG